MTFKKKSDINMFIFTNIPYKHLQYKQEKFICSK